MVGYDCLLACLLPINQRQTKKYVTMWRRLSLNTCSQNGVLLTLLPDREGGGLERRPHDGRGREKGIIRLD